MMAVLHRPKVFSDQATVLIYSYQRILHLSNAIADQDWLVSAPVIFQRLSAYPPVLA